MAISLRSFRLPLSALHPGDEERLLQLVVFFTAHAGEKEGHPGAHVLLFHPARKELKELLRGQVLRLLEESLHPEGRARLLILNFNNGIQVHTFFSFRGG